MRCETLSDRGSCSAVATDLAEGGWELACLADWYPEMKYCSQGQQGSVCWLREHVMKVIFLGNRVHCNTRIALASSHGLSSSPRLLKYCIKSNLG